MNAHVTAENILDSLKTLPRGEVDDVRKAINAYLSFGVWDADADEPEVTSSAARRVFRLVAEEMQAAGLADMQAMSYWRLPNRRAFATKAEHLVAFLKEQHRDLRVQDGILRIGIQLLIRWLQRYAETQDFTVTPVVVSQSIHKIPARLDREFPGYGAVGLLHLLVAR